MVGPSQTLRWPPPGIVATMGKEGCLGGGRRGKRGVVVNTGATVCFSELENVAWRGALASFHFCVLAARSLSPRTCPPPQRTHTPPHDSLPRVSVHPVPVTRALCRPGAWRRAARGGTADAVLGEEGKKNTVAVLALGHLLPQGVRPPATPADRHALPFTRPWRTGVIKVQGREGVDSEAAFRPVEKVAGTGHPPACAAAAVEREREKRPRRGGGGSKGSLLPTNPPCRRTPLHPHTHTQAERAPASSHTAA